MLSVWLTPWFARWTVIPFLGLFRKKAKAVENTMGNTLVKEGKQDINQMK